MRYMEVKVRRLCICFFFFSSRRRHTRSLRDWSSDVCSSDLDGRAGRVAGHGRPARGDDRPRRHDRRREEIGRASCRERVEIAVVAATLKKKKKISEHLGRSTNMHLSYIKQ